MNNYGYKNYSGERYLYLPIENKPLDINLSDKHYNKEIINSITDCNDWPFNLENNKKINIDELKELTDFKIFDVLNVGKRNCEYIIKKCLELCLIGKNLDQFTDKQKTALNGILIMNDNYLIDEIIEKPLYTIGEFFAEKAGSIAAKTLSYESTRCTRGRKINLIKNYKVISKDLIYKINKPILTSGGSRRKKSRSRSKPKRKKSTKRK
jgi:hypothetical protein